MKKLFGVFAVAASLLLGVADQARAGGPFCLTFPNFCDSITIRTITAGGRGWIVGNWDSTCAGDLIPVIGVTSGFAFGTRFDGDGAFMFKVFGALGTVQDLHSTTAPAQAPNRPGSQGRLPTRAPSWGRLQFRDQVNPEMAPS